MPRDNYFDTPFADSGTRASIPDALDPTGLVSYTQGFTIDYQLASGPSKKDIPRDKFNGLIYEITKAIQTIQQNGAWLFITSTMNGGSPFSYKKNVQVLSGGVIYQSLIDNNMDTPPSSNWAEPDISGGGTVTSLSVVTTHGLSGTVANPTTTPAITLSTYISGVVKADGTSFSAAAPGVDYVAPNGSGSNGAAKVTINFNGTGTVAIRGSYNVSSLTDLGVGDYRVNFSITTPNTDYVVLYSGKERNDTTPATAAACLANQTVANCFSTTSIRVAGINTATGAQLDMAYMGVAIF